MEGNHPARDGRFAPWPTAAGRRGVAFLAALVCAVLYAGRDCIAVRATGEIASPAMAPAGFQRTEVGAAPPTARIANLATPDTPLELAARDPLVAPSGEGARIARADSPFLSDAVARDPASVAAALPRTFGGAWNDPASHIALRRLEPGAVALRTAKLDEERLNVNLPADDFRETGPGTLAASMSGLDVDAVRSVAGGRIQLVTAASDRGRTVAEARLSWVFEYLQTDTNVTAFFAPGDKGIFAVQGLSLGSNWGLLGWGFRWEFLNGLSAYAHYDAQANSQRLFHIGSGGIAYAW